MRECDKEHWNSESAVLIVPFVAKQSIWQSGKDSALSAEKL
jgi:hypothetical protein